MSIDKDEFDLEEAITQSKEQLIEFLVDSLLYDPKTDKHMFVVAPPSLNPDGSVTLLCATQVDPDEYIAHTFVSMYVDKNDVTFGGAPEDEDDSDSGLISDPNSGKLIGLDGKPLN
jgi:hypothetical protein